MPWWLFLLIALYCYLTPFFRPLSMAPAFAILVFMGWTIEPAFFWAVYAAVTLSLILGIKDFVIVNRKTAYQLLVFLLSFAGCLLVFGSFEAWSTPASFLSLALLSLLWFWLLCGAPERQDSPALPAAISALLLFEVGAIIFFLPISFFSQAALLFFASALLFETATDLRSLSLKQIFAWGGSYAAISLLVVWLASWKV